MLRNWQFRLYPNKAQETALGEMLDAYRTLYNAALQERRDAYRRCHVSLNYYDQANQLKDIRANGDELARFSYSTAQQVLRRLDKAFKAFFERVKRGETPGFPRFKSARRFNSVPFRFGDGATLKDGRLNLTGVGRVKVKWHRDIPADAAIKQVIVKRDGDKWYACFAIELPDLETPVHPGPVIGVDLGLSALVTLSTGEKVEPPRPFRKAQAKLRRQQRRASRRKKFSRGWRKAQRQVAKTHARIANQRKDVAHKLSRRLAGEFSLIAVEDLNILGLAKSNLAKSVLDAGWSQLLQFTAYKVEETGSRLVAVDPRGTSQFCSGCGCRVQKDLSVRVHRCPECGVVLDRDENAALNILYRALDRLGLSREAITWPGGACVASEAAAFYAAE